MNRRDFIKTAALAGVGVTIGGSRTLHAAEPHAGPYFCVFNANGGWDTTALMDPKGTPDINRQYTVDQILQTGSISYAPTAGFIAPGAMTNEEFFGRYGSELLVVNGVDISVNNHSPCTRYMGSGKLDSDRYPAFGALAAAALAPDAPLSFLALEGYSATGSVIAKNSISDFPSLLTLARADYVDYDSASRYLHEGSVSAIDEALAQGDATLPGHRLAQRFIRDAQTNSRDLGWVEPFVPDSLPDDPLRRKVEVALAGFASGACCTATLGLSQFDSHANNDPDQMDLIPQLLRAVDHLMVRAEELGIRDQLVVVMQSEMGRTPWYNDNDSGKDHWSVGSMMFMGAGIDGGRVVGATTVDPQTGYEQWPRSIDPQTLQLDDAGIRIRPEHIHQALREFAGASQHALADEFDLGVAQEERLVGLFG